MSAPRLAVVAPRTPAPAIGPIAIEASAPSLNCFSIIDVRPLSVMMTKMTSESWMPAWKPKLAPPTV